MCMKTIKIKRSELNDSVYNYILTGNIYEGNNLKIMIKQFIELYGIYQCFYWIGLICFVIGLSTLNIIWLLICIIFLLISFVIAILRVMAIETKTLQYHLGILEIEG